MENLWLTLHSGIDPEVSKLASSDQVNGLKPVDDLIKSGIIERPAEAEADPEARSENINSDLIDSMTVQEMRDLIREQKATGG